MLLNIMFIKGIIIWFLFGNNWMSVKNNKVLFSVKIKVIVVW